MLLVAVNVGVRVPGLEFLLPLRDPAALDYSAGIPGGFFDLSREFVADVLGLGGPARGPDGSPQTSATAPVRDQGPGSEPVPAQQQASIRPLSNDSFTRAATVSGVPYEGRTRTVGATRQPGEPRSCGRVQGGTVWFRYRSSSDVALIANTLGSSYGTALAVYRGTGFGSLESLGCHASATGDSLVAFPATRGTTYYFQVGATLLRGGDLVFRLVRQRTVTRVSVSSTGALSDGSSRQAIVSGNGRYVAFISTAHTLVRGAGPTKCWDYPKGPAVPVLPIGGGLIAGDSTCHQLYLHDRVTHATTLISRSSSGEPANAGAMNAALSYDGRYIAFESAASNLVDDDTNECPSNYLLGHGGEGCVDVFVHDRVTQTTKRVSVSSSGAQALGGSTHPSISADGRYIAFESEAPNLVVGDATTCVSLRAFHPVYPLDNEKTIGCLDVFVHDMFTGETELISTGLGGLPSNGPSWGPSISADGRHVAFSSAASNLVRGDVWPCVQVPNGNCADVFVRDRLREATTMASVSSDGRPGNADSWGSRLGKNFMSDDGRYVAFYSWARNLVPGDTNGNPDIFVHDRVTRRTVRASVASGGEQVNADIPRTFTISANGRFVAFHGRSLGFVPGEKGTETDVYVHDLWTRTTILGSVSPTGEQGNAQSSYPTLSRDGRVLAFSSDATNLVPQENEANQRLCGGSRCNDVYAVELYWPDP